MTRATERLLARLGPRAAGLAASPALDGVLDAQLAAAERRLPHRPIAREQLVDRIADALAAGDDPIGVAELERLCAGDLYFACALAAADPQALALAEAELVPAARDAARRIDPDRAFVDEIVQRVRERLLVGDAPAIARYRGAAPLVRWVRVIASRIALDHRRREQPGDDEDALAQLPAPTDPRLDLIWRSSAAEYRRALEAAFAGLDRRDRLLLRQRYVDDLDIDALGRMYRVHPSTAFRRLERVHERLAAATRDSLRAELALTSSQVDSLERLVATHLELSLTGLLRGRRR